MSEAEILNQIKLKDPSLKGTKKLKSTAYLKKETWQQLDAIVSLDDVSSRNEALERAILFYHAFLSSQLGQDYLCGVFGRKMDASLRLFGDRMAKLEFKTAVGLEILTRILSNDLDITKEEYERLRKTAVDHVKKVNGSINIYEAAKSPNIK